MSGEHLWEIWLQGDAREVESWRLGCIRAPDFQTACDKWFLAFPDSLYDTASLRYGGLALVPTEAEARSIEHASMVQTGSRGAWNYPDGIIKGRAVSRLIEGLVHSITKLSHVLELNNGKLVSIEIDASTYLSLKRWFDALEVASDEAGAGMTICGVRVKPDVRSNARLF